MAEITLRVPLGRPLTYQEVDDNFKSVQELTLLAQSFALTAQEASTLADEAKNEAIAAKDEALTASGSAASNAQRAEDAADRAEAISGFDGLHNTLAGRNEPGAHDASAINYGESSLKTFLDSLYSGVDIRPALRFDFSNQGYLDPRIEFTRASKDWDSQGREYGVGEPVITGEGLWTSGARTNLKLNAQNVQSIPVTAQTYTLSFYGSGTIALSGAHSHAVTGSGGRTTYTFTPTVGQLNIAPSGVERVQLEEGKIATSYIPTEGSQVTVAATNTELDVDGFFGDEGTFVFDVYMYGPRKEPGFALTMLGDGGSSEYVGLGYGIDSPNGLYLASGGSNSNIALDVNLRPQYNNPTVFAFTWSGRDFAFFVNGTKVHFGTHGAPMPVYKTLHFGRRGDILRSPINSRNLQLYKKRLSDEQLQELTKL